MLLSACLIVKDEEDFLEGCLVSLTGIVDEIVCVDTGSSDRTVDLAKAYGSRVFYHPWNDDFAEARNASLAQARGQWIIIIDADERLRPIQRPDLEKFLQDPLKVAYQCPVYYLPDWTPSHLLRLFRNYSHIRYVGLIHESIEAAVLRVVSEESLAIGRCDLAFDHVGYSGGPRHKYDRDLRLLTRALENDPDHSFHWTRLGLIYYHLGKQAQAQAACERAIGLQAKLPGTPPYLAYPYVLLLRLGLTQGKDMGDLLAAALALFPHNPTLVFFQGWICLQAGRLEEAISSFRRVIAWGQNRDFDQSVSHECRILHEYAYDSLAACHFQMGEYDKAWENYHRACQHAPQKLEYQVKQELCRRLSLNR